MAAALAGGAQAAVERLGSMAFVLVEGLLSEAPLTPPYAKRLEAVSALLATGERVTSPCAAKKWHRLATCPRSSPTGCEAGKAEGMVIRSTQGMIYKVKSSQGSPSIRSSPASPGAAKTLALCAAS